MRKIIFYLLLLISTVSFGQTTIANKLKITAAIKDNLASRVMVQDSLTGELKWVLKNSLGTVKSVTGTSGVTVALGTSTPVIGLGAITPTSTNGVSATTMAYNDATSSIQTQLNGKQPVGTYATGTGSATGTNTGDNAVNTLYSGLVSNATHTGDATGATALTVKGINGTLLSGLATGILKNTTTTGVPSIAIASDFPTLNQNTTGTASNITGVYGGTITSSQVTTGLGFTPYNATNPSGYTSNTGTVTNVSALTLGTTGTDLSSSVATGTTTPVITLNVPTASATNRGVLSSTDWSTFNGKQNALTNPITGTGTSGYVSFWNGTSTQTSDSGLFWDNTYKRLGIGTTNPDTGKTTILKNSTYNSYTGAGLSLQSNTANVYTELQLGADDTQNIGYIQSLSKNTSFSTKPLALQPNGGSVLIGTIIDSGNKLRVNGTVRLDNLSGTGTRTVVADASGNLSTTSTSNPNYKVYTALLTQSGTSAPTATVLENTLGGTVVWTRSTNGSYIGTLAEVFTLNKTAVLISCIGTSYISSFRSSVNTITVNTYVTSGGAADDRLFGNTIEIRVYN